MEAECSRSSWEVRKDRREGEHWRYFILTLIANSELVRKGFLEEEYFRETENHDLIPNSLPNGGGEAMEFLGRVLGKAVYENILVEPRFGLIFLKKVLGRTNQADDLRFHDAAFFSNLMKLKSPDVDPSDLDLDFTITSSTTLAGQHTETRAQDLVPGGRSIDVTKTNVLSYIFHVAHHMLNVELSAAVKRFLKGFREIIPASWITMFSPRELQKIIGGDDEGGIGEVQGAKPEQSPSEARRAPS